MKRYILSLTKTEVNQLYALVQKNEKEVKVSARNKLHEAYIRMNDIVVNDIGL